MEHQQNHSPDKKPRDPKAEQLHTGEIDYTSTSQEDDLRDVVDAALAETKSAEGVIPDWGAQPLARALADRVAESLSGLRHFANTGSVNRKLILHELAIICASSADEETHKWAEQLGAYVMTLSDEPGLAARPELAPTVTAEASFPNTRQITQGIRDYGGPFRAFLYLPDIDWHRDDLLTEFLKCYIGSFPSMDELIDGMTEARACQVAIDEIAGRFGFTGLAKLDRTEVAHRAREAWSVIEAGGELHVFEK